MMTLYFTVYIVTFALLDLAWGLITPTWVVLATLFFYIVIATVEFKLDIKAKEVWAWVRYNSGR